MDWILQLMLNFALKDAEKVMSFRSNSVKSYILQADAVFLLEKYELARESALAGLQIDPLCDHLQSFLLILERPCSDLMGGRTRGKPDRTDDFDCTLCLKLIYEPVTTPCGHSFCRSCLFQSMDRSNAPFVEPYYLSLLGRAIRRVSPAWF